MSAHVTRTAAPDLPAGFDYVDAFTLEGVTPPPPRVAADRMLAGATAAGGVFALGIWRGALGLHVAPSRPGTLAGWTVETDDPDLLVVAADGRRLRGRMTFATTPDGLTWTTALSYGHPVARPTWAALGPVHRALVPRLLRRLAASLPTRS